MTPQRLVVAALAAVGGLTASAVTASRIARQRSADKSTAARLRRLAQQPVPPPPVVILLDPAGPWAETLQDIHNLEEVAR